MAVGCRAILPQGASVSKAERFCGRQAQGSLDEPRRHLRRVLGRGDKRPAG